MVELKRRNRKTKTVIALHFCSAFVFLGRFHYAYWMLECQGHGYTTDDISTRREAEKLMAHPDEWCIGCIEGWEQD